MTGPVAVVVPTRDRPDQLARCLAALRPQLLAGDELIVADSASRARDAVARVASDAGARLVRCELPGASRARNTGWRAAKAPWVVFVDDDMVVRPGWLEALRPLQDLDGVAFAGGRTVAPQSSSGTPASITLVSPPEVLRRGVRGPLAGSNNLAVRREALERVGGFDERLGPGAGWLDAGEDLELLDRLLEQGWTGRHVPSALAEHEQWRSAAERRRLEYAYGKGMGARVAAAVRRHPVRGWALLPEVLRLGGLVTLARRALPGTGPIAPAEDLPAVGERVDSGGWLLPVLWRLGALLGLAVGLVRLPPLSGAGGRPSP
jgi:glucosyl-dolichyl phosphate glucuronosyltransferase